MSISFYVISGGVVQMTESDDQSRGFRGYYTSPEVFTFPGGEHHLRNIPEFKEPVTWVADVRGSDPNDLVKAALLANVSRGSNFHKRLDDHFVLMLSYLPAARADRGEPLGARVYANYVNAVGADHVICLDPHSDVMPGMIHNLQVIRPLDMITRALSSVHALYDGVIAPDQGAAERTKVIADVLNLPLLQARKHRDFETGRIEKVELLDRVRDKDNYLVVDDICDGGGTFMQLAQATDLPLDHLGLWVTHGIFSGKADQLRSCYGEIYVTDSHPGYGRVGVATHVELVWPQLIQYAIAYDKKRNPSS